MSHELFVLFITEKDNFQQVVNVGCVDIKQVTMNIVDCCMEMHMPCFCINMSCHVCLRVRHISSEAII